MIEVPYLTREKIEADATHLLQDAHSASKIQYDPPIDVESIVELYLKLELELVNIIDNNIFGALDVKNGIVKINAAFDPHGNRKFEGLYHYTLGHEVGHFVEHVPLLHENEVDAVLCRSSQAYIPIEWQANYFAACLLMPSDLVVKAFVKLYGSQEPYRSESILIKAAYDPRFKKVARAKKCSLDVMKILDLTFEKLARIFSVSPRAMVIRLKELGLLIVEGPLTEACKHSFVWSV